MPAPAGSSCAYSSCIPLTPVLSAFRFAPENSGSVECSFVLTPFSFSLRSPCHLGRLHRNSSISTATETRRSVFFHLLFAFLASPVQSSRRSSPLLRLHRRAKTVRPDLPARPALHHGPLGCCHVLLPSTMGSSPQPRGHPARPSRNSHRVRAPDKMIPQTPCQRRRPDE